MRNRLAIAALIGLLVLTACGGTKSKSSPKNFSLRMTMWSANNDHRQLLNEIADEYRKTHPDITAITFDPLPFGYLPRRP